MYIDRFDHQPTAVYQELLSIYTKQIPSQRYKQFNQQYGLKQDGTCPGWDQIIKPRSLSNNTIIDKYTVNFYL